MMDKSDGTTEEPHRELIDKFRVKLVQSIDPDRQFLFSYLRSKQVFDDEDCELILKTGASRQQKVSKFLDMLMLKGEEGCNHFIDALEYEHPKLFEEMSGKEASISRMIPSPIPTGQSAWDFTTGLAGKELIDFDRQYLAQQLEKMTVDFQKLTYVHSKTVREKNSLEHRLQESVRDLEIQEKANTDLKYEIKALGEQVNETRKQTTQGAEPVNRYIQELILDNMKKNNMAIELHSRLLANGDELEQAQKSISELRLKNENLMKQIKELVINYDTERRQSKRLNDKVRKQTDQMRQVDEYKKENYELKYKVAELTAERDDVTSQLEEFRKVTEALNAKYDLLTQEKNMALEYQNHFQGQYLSIEQQALLFEGKLREANRKADEWQRRYERIKEELFTTKEQRDTLVTERESALDERSNAVRERDELRRQCEETQEAKNKAVDKQIEINKKLEVQYRSALKELDDAKEELEQLQNSFLSLQNKERAASLQWSEDPHSDSEVMPSGWDSGRDSDGDDGEKRSRSASNMSSGSLKGPDAANKHIIHAYPWRKRSHLDVLRSAYVKINDNDEMKRRVDGKYKRHSEGIIKGLKSNEHRELFFWRQVCEESAYSAPNISSLIGNLNLGSTLESPTDSSEISENATNDLPFGHSFNQNVYIPSRRSSEPKSSSTDDDDDISLTPVSFTARSISSSPSREKDLMLDKGEKSKDHQATDNAMSGFPGTVSGHVGVNEEGHILLHRKKAARNTRGQKTKADVFSSFLPGVTKMAIGLAAPHSVDGMLPLSSSTKGTDAKAGNKSRTLNDGVSPAKNSEPVEFHGKAETLPATMPHSRVAEYLDSTENRLVSVATTETEINGKGIQKSSSSTSLSVPQASNLDVADKASPKNVAKKGLSSRSMNATQSKKVNLKNQIRQRRNSWTVTDQAEV